MRVEAQSTDQILDALTSLEVDWTDATSIRISEKILKIPAKTQYDREDLRDLLSEFEDGKLIIRLFLGLSKDEFETSLAYALTQHGVPKTGTGQSRYLASPLEYLSALEALGILEAIQQTVNTPVTWNDLLLERLRMGRGRAIRGQIRGRSLEDFVESLIRQHFDVYHARCTFTGRDSQRVAKADFAIPSRTAPSIIIEAKGYAATGSKQTDVIGDLTAIAEAKRPDTVLIFFTDGLTWRQRQSDLRKIVTMQNHGLITRIYTRAMSEQFSQDLSVWKREFGL